MKSEAERSFRFLLLMLVITWGLGCDNTGMEMDEVPPSVGEKVAIVTSEVEPVCDLDSFESYIVCYEPGRSGVQSNGTTTFAYSVEPKPGKKPSFNYFSVEYPDCATGTPYGPLASTSPSNSVKVGPNPDMPDVQVVLWESSVPKNKTYYSYTLRGSVPLGNVQTIIRGGPQVASATLPGACKGAATRYDVQGTVYVETDSELDGGVANPFYGSLENEPSLEGITVELLDVLGNSLGTDQTDAQGFYSFVDVPAGSGYSVVVPRTPTGNVFLYDQTSVGSLYTFACVDSAAFTCTTTDDGSVAVSFSLIANTTLDLGFAPNTDALLFALNNDPAYQSQNPLPFKELEMLIGGAFIDYNGGAAKTFTPGSLQGASVATASLATASMPVNDGTFVDDPAYGWIYQIQAQNYFVKYLGSNFSDNTTTFYYEAEGLGNLKVGKSDLSHITFEVEGSGACSGFKGAIALDPTTGVTGQKFDGVSKTSKKLYALSFEGNVDAPGVIDVGLKLGSGVMIARLPGPCADALGDASTAAGKGTATTGAVLTSDDLLAGLATIFFEGGSDVPFLQADPLVLPVGTTVVEETLRLLALDEDFSDDIYILDELNQLLLVKELISLYGLASTDPDVTEFIFRFSEAVIEALQQQASKGTGSSGGTAGTLLGGI